MFERLLPLLAVCLFLGCPGASDDDDTAMPDDDTAMPDDDTADDDAGDDDAADDDTAMPDDDTAAEAPLPTELAGWISVTESMWDGQTSGSTVYAEFWGETLPTSEVLVDEAGDCKLIVGDRTESWLCDPPCDVDEICIAEECVAYPEVAPSGTVTVAGTVEDVVLEPDGTGRYPLMWDLPVDLFASGDAIDVTSTGGATPALDLHATGVAPMVAPGTPWDFEPGQDYHLTWEPEPSSPGRIQVLLQTGWHGSVNLTTILCETEDDGELTVPASLTAEFQIPSCGECEMSYLSRFTRDWVDFGDGPIELLVASRIQFVPWWDWY